MIRKFQNNQAAFCFMAVLILIGLGSTPRMAVAGAAAVPYVEGISPASAPIGGASFTLTVRGVNFTNASVVRWTSNGVVTPLATTFVDAEDLTATVNAGLVTSYGTAAVTVFTPGALVSNVAYLTVTNPSAFLTFRLTQQSPSGGNHPYFPVTGVFNTQVANSPLDLAVTNDTSGVQTPPGVSVFVGDGYGSFRGAGNSTYSVGNDPQGLVIGDFNGDGVPDLVSVDNQSATISVLLGNGDNTFQIPLTTLLAPNSRPTLAVAADLNGDGKLDLAVACEGTTVSGVGNVTVLLGNGDGSFQAPVSYKLGTASQQTQPGGLALADFDGNGTLDLAVSDTLNSAIWILSGNGDGTFSSPGTAFQTATAPAGIVTADFNGDGMPDLAVAYESSAAASVLLNNTGAFPVHVEYPVADGGLFLAAADLNGDGILDLAVPGDTSNNVSVLLGNGSNGIGDGTFGAFTGYTVGSAFTSTLGITAGDFNQDGRLDLAFTVGTILNSTNDIAVLVQSPQWTPDPTSLTFGNQAMGTQSIPQTVAFTNTGAAPLVLNALTSTDTANFPETNTCGHLPKTFPPGLGCTVTVTFNPSVPGNLSADVSVTDNITAPQSPQLIALTGTGTQPAVILAPASLTFSSQAVGTISLAQTVTLTNTGSSNLTITSVAATGDFGETNTCSGTVVPNGTCTISVTFTPTASATRSGSISVTDNAPGSPQTVPLTGTGTAPVAGLNPASLTFAGQLVSTTSAPQRVTLTNTGSANLTITSIVASGDFGETNSCTSPVAPAASCSITVTFTPKASGARNGAITISDNASGSPQSVSLSGTGTQPLVSLAPASLTFGSQILNTTTSSQAVTLTNTGTATLTITSVVAGSNFSATNTCGGSVLSGASCKVNVTFTPSAGGTLTGVLTLTDNASPPGQTINLTGTGAVLAAVASPGGLTFSGQLLSTTGAGQNVTLTNTGTVGLNITSLAATGDFSETNTCGTSLAASAKCTVTVSFKPSATGTRSGTLTVTGTNNSGAGNATATETVSLSGTGTAPVASLSTLPAFAGQAVGTTSAAQNVTVSNTGTAPLSVSGITITGTNAGDFAQTNTCSAAVAAGANCSISVTFAPSAAGPRAGTLTVTDNNNGTAGSTQTVSLTGTGTAPGVTLSPASLTFGNQNLGSSSAAQNITITNNGTAALSLNRTVASGDFSQSSACGSSLAAGASCTVAITFKPAALFSRSGTLTVTDNASPGTQSVSLTGTGMGAQATVSASSLTFSGELVGVASAAKTVTLQNTGNASMTGAAIAVSGDFAETNTCTSTIAANSSCTITVTFKASTAGARNGSLTFTNSASGSPQTVALSGTGQDFTLTGSAPASVTPGQTATYTVTLTPLDGLDQAISLACSGAASESACTISEPSVTPTGATSIKVTVTTTAPSAVMPTLPSLPPLGGSLRWRLLGVMGLMGTMLLARRKSQAWRLRPALAGIALLVLLALGMAACGGSSSSSSTGNSNPGTPAGTYSLTVAGTATSGAVTVTHNAVLNLTVK